MDELDRLLADEPVEPATMAGAAGRRCGHPKSSRGWLWPDDIISGVYHPDAKPICAVCRHVFNPEVARRNRLNRGRGKGTSKDLAKYLGLDWQNVEGLNWPWDVQGPAGRIQSKREIGNYGAVSALRIIDAIPQGNWLRALYYVAPGRRVASGEITVTLDEWIQWHGWTPPPQAVVLRGPQWLLRLPLPAFRDIHCAVAPQPDDVTIARVLG